MASKEHMSAQPVSELTVFQHGLGKAGVNLHGGVWNGLGVNRIGFDTSEDRRQSASETGLTVIDDMSKVGRIAVDVYDNTTSTGYHAQSVDDFLRYAEAEPAAYLLEKPVATADERLQMEANLEQMGRESVFVNENYLALRAVTRSQEIMMQLAEAGVEPTEILVHFTKDRVPNVVLDGRFTDSKGLSVYGIEMPHMLAVASALAGSELKTDDPASIVENRFLHDIDGIEQSEGNVTVLKQNGIKVTMRQGLGPFDFADDNELVRREYDWKTNEADRYAHVAFNDGSTLRITMDPVPNAPRFHSKIEYTAHDAQASFEEVFEDNSLKNLIGAVATYAASGRTERPLLLDNIGPDVAMRYAEQLTELRTDAGEPESVGALSDTRDSFAAAYYDSLKK